MRYYTTKPMNGGTTFTCTFCGYNVTTLDFDSANGNHRMQAAVVINRHATLLHLRGPVPTKVRSNEVRKSGKSRHMLFQRDEVNMLSTSMWR